MKKNHLLIGGAIALALVATAAGAYFINNANPPQKPVQTVQSHPHMQQAQAQPHQAPPPPACNDNNIVGTGLGAVAGGVLGSQIGHGTGKTVATIGGVVAGGVAGHELIPTNGVTCRR